MLTRQAKKELANGLAMMAESLGFILMYSLGVYVYFAGIEFMDNQVVDSIATGFVFIFEMLIATVFGVALVLTTVMAFSAACWIILAPLKGLVLFVNRPGDYIRPAAYTEQVADQRI